MSYISCVIWAIDIVLFTIYAVHELRKWVREHPYDARFIVNLTITIVRGHYAGFVYLRNDGTIFTVARDSKNWPLWEENDIRIAGCPMTTWSDFLNDFGPYRFGPEAVKLMRTHKYTFVKWVPTPTFKPLPKATGYNPFESDLSRYNEREF